MDIGRREVIAAAVAASVPIRRASAEDPPPPHYRTATDLVAALANRQITSRQLTEACISRIEAMDDRINAVVVRDFDRARQEADRADAALAAGERRPLLGLPMTVKEQYNVAGLPTTWGFERFKDWKAPEDALAVQRLKAAGAVILGKTNVPAGLSDWQSYNPVYGTTSNPWDVTRTPGGSSGGAAAALAAGFVPLELGSDIGGSLRAPAHFCGIYAHKPSLDLIPQRGSGYPESPAIPVRGDMSVCGPMARSPADLALALSVLAGPDPLWDGKGYKLDLPPPRHDRLAEYRVLVIGQHPLCATAASVKQAIDRLAEQLTQAGCTVLRQHRDMPDLARTTRVYDEALSAFFAADLAPEDRLRVEALAAALAPEDLALSATELRGLTRSHAAWIKTARIREGLRVRWEALLRDVDLILAPPMPTPAFPQDQSKPLYDRKLDVDGRKIPYDNQIAYCGIATMCGLPATAAPLGLTETGLPVGVQIIGGYLEDRTTIAFAGLLERAFGGFRPPPAFA
jgi:amidase